MKRGIKRKKSGSKIGVNQIILLIILLLIVLLPIILNLRIIGSVISQLGSIFPIFTAEKPYFDPSSYSIVVPRGYDSFEMFLKNVPLEMSRGEIYAVVPSLGKTINLYSFGNLENPYISTFEDNQIPIILYSNVLKELNNKQILLSYNLVTPSQTLTGSIRTSFNLPSPSPSSSPSSGSGSNPSSSPGSSGTPTPPSNPSAGPSPDPGCSCKNIEMLTSESSDSTLGPAISALNEGRKPNQMITKDNLKPRYLPTQNTIERGWIIKATCKAKDKDNLKKCFEGQEVKSTLEVRDKGSEVTAKKCRGPKVNQMINLLPNQFDDPHPEESNPDMKCYNPPRKDNGDIDTEKDDTTVDACKKDNSPSKGFGDDGYHESEALLKTYKQKAGTEDQWEVLMVDYPSLIGGSSSEKSRTDYYHAWVTGDDCTKDNPKCNLCWTLEIKVNKDDNRGRESGSVGNDRDKPNYIILNQVQCKFNS